MTGASTSAETCPAGLHPRSDVYVYPSGTKWQCRGCKRLATLRYLASPKGREAQARKFARYNNSTKGYLRARRHRLKVRRADIQRRLDELAAEEAELWALGSTQPHPTR